MKMFKMMAIRRLMEQTTLYIQVKGNITDQFTQMSLKTTKISSPPHHHLTLSKSREVRLEALAKVCSLSVTRKKTKVDKILMRKLLVSSRVLSMCKQRRQGKHSIIERMS
jgi:hypothetical protein